jgi:ligand-binding sensor domain-containing protein
MRVYRAIENDATSLTAGYITSLALDSDGKLWAGTAEMGVNRYDPTTDRFTQFAMAGTGITAIARDVKGRMWFATTRGGLSRFDGDRNELVAYTDPPLDVAITAIAVDAEGNLWLGTAGTGVIRWNPDTGSSESLHSDDSAAMPAVPITAILAAENGTIWIGSEGEGLVSFDPKSRKLKGFRRGERETDGLSDDHVVALYQDRQKTLWIGTANGLNRLDASGRIVHYQHDPQDPTSLAFPRVESLFQDAGGVMWVGGFTVGVCKFDEFRSKFGRFRTRTHPVNSFHEDADGTLWVGTYHGGLYKYDWASKQVTHYQRLDDGSETIDLESAWIASLHRDRRGMLWISLQGRGLIALDTKTLKYKQYVADAASPGSLPVDTVWDVSEDDQGKLWLASWGAGLVRFDPARDTFEMFTSESKAGLSSDHLYTLLPDPRDKNILWIGAAKGGVTRFDRTTGRGQNFRHADEDPNSISSDDVLALYRDASGSVWLGTYGGGLNRLDPETGKAQRFTTNNSRLTNDVIFGILPDAEGQIWLSTNGGGLVQFDPRSQSFLAYRVADGVQGNEFAQGAFKRSASGRLYFGGVDGFNAFDPKEITRDSYLPPVVFTGLKLFGQEVELATPIWTLPKLNLSYSDSFELQFAALSFAAPGQNRYAYKLEGFDDTFIETDRPFAPYTKLERGGTFTLRVRAANRHGVWNESETAIKVFVKPPFWRTWPAYIVYMALLVGIVLLVWHLQRQRVQRVIRDSRLAVVERDLALTGAVQTGFLPEYNEIAGGLVKLFGFYRGADACSGDWWWHQRLGHRHLVLVGDVTGHGPGAAMVTAAVASTFRTIVEVGLEDLKVALEVLHRSVLAVAKGKYTMTMAALELNELTGEWHLLSAGAPPIISLSNAGKHRVHFCAGTPLGIEGTFEPGELTGTLKPGERVLVYTDGIPEIEMPNGQPLGMRRLAQVYERTRPQDLRDAASTIVQTADENNGSRPQDDDWTFAIVEWTGEKSTVGAPHAENVVT